MYSCCRVPALVRELSMHSAKDLEMALDLARAREMQEEDAKQVAMLHPSCESVKACESMEGGK